MTVRQNILKTFYPLLIRINKHSNKNARILLNENKVIPPASFYELKSLDNKDKMVGFEKFAGRKVMIVNTASDCGYTAQYEELQKLFGRFKDKLIILGFPSSDFGNQEKGTNEEIARFCINNYGITFSLMKKSVVTATPEQNEVYKWLTDPGKNGWNNHQPDWNFSKYIVNEAGLLTHYFGPAVSPQGKDIKMAIR
jgi:glutathione peroxidase